MSLKNPVTIPGIDPGTVRLVAQRLNPSEGVVMHNTTAYPTSPSRGTPSSHKRGSDALVRAV